MLLMLLLELWGVLGDPWSVEFVALIFGRGDRGDSSFRGFFESGAKGCCGTWGQG